MTFLTVLISIICSQQQKHTIEIHCIILGNETEMPCPAGSSTTKEILESTFAHLTDISKRQSKNQRLAFYSRWLYAASSPYPRESAPQLLPTDEEWLTFRTSDASLMKEFAKLGNVKGQKLPEITYGEDSRFPRRPAEIVYRHAGPLSHQKSAAAIALVLHEVENDFRNIHGSWLGLVVPLIPAP